MLHVSHMTDRRLITALTQHISVCVCTFKRADLLRRLLDRLEYQQTDGLFTYSAVVSDNDGMESAREVVAAFSATSRLIEIAPMLRAGIPPFVEPEHGSQGFACPEHGRAE